MNLFLVKVNYSKLSERGSEVKMVEDYVVDALSFTETEARILKEMEPFLGDQFEIKTMAKSTFSEILEDETADKYYKCKIAFITFDEEKGKEKRTVKDVLVQASDLENALQNLKEGFKDVSVDWDTTMIQDTKIMDVFKYFEQDEPVDECNDIAEVI